MAGQPKPSFHDVIRFLVRRVSTGMHPEHVRNLLLAIDEHESIQGGPSMTEETQPTPDPGAAPDESLPAGTQGDQGTTAPAPEQPAAEPATEAPAPEPHDHDPSAYDPTRTSSGEERARTVGDPDHAPED